MNKLKIASSNNNITSPIDTDAASSYICRKAADMIEEPFHENVSEFEAKREEKEYGKLRTLFNDVCNMQLAKWPENKK